MVAPSVIAVVMLVWLASPAVAQCAGTKAIELISCLGDPDPKIRDAMAFETLSKMMRAGELDTNTLAQLDRDLIAMVAKPDPNGFQRPFAILTLAEVARTDRIKPWMTDADRDTLVTTAAQYLSSITDYRAFDDTAGFRHGVAHGADLAMQLALNPATTKPQLDRLLAAITSQITPPNVAYWAGEPDRLARAVMFIAQRKLHSDAEWKAWFDRIMDPKPLASWDQAFRSELGIKKHHDARAFLLSVFATASTTDDTGIKALLEPVRSALKLVQ